VDAEVDGRTVFFIGRDALLKNKAATGRPKDIADIARLSKMGGPRRPPHAPDAAGPE